ncbi:MAG: ankyrin repeat domain-containing protein [Hydrogenophaga sp.]|nr:ankyrin repeat domain-containing protein [Hydrogenophaga sp.]
MKPDNDELLRRYHEANALDPARPDPSLRDLVLTHARAAAQTQRKPGTGRLSAANEAAWRWRAFGGLAVLGLATLVVLQFDRSTPEERKIALGETAAPPATAPARSAIEGREAAPAEQDAQARAGAPVDRNSAPRARSLAREEAPAALSSQRAAAPSPAASPNDALLAAAARGAINGVREALAQGADVNAANATGRSALMLAAQRGDAPLVRLLLDAGADPLRTDRDGLRAADLAQQAGHSALLPLLDGLR